MSKTERKRIIDYIFRHPDTPEDIRQQFERWMLAREHDSGIDEILWDIWENHAAPASEEEDRRGLERLRASLRASRVRTLPRRVLRYAGMAAAVVLVFLGGYFAATQTLAPEKEVTLLTAKGHVGEFTLPDGTKVWLNGESRLKYNAEFSGRTRDVALTGEAFFEVRKDTLRPFRVSMNDLQVEVLGTSFDVMNYAFGSSEEVVLKTGSVKISGEHLRSHVTLRPDERFSLDRLSKRACVEKVDARNYSQWFSSRLIFDNTPLKDIIINLERRYNIEISLSSNISPEKRLSLVVCHEPLEDLMEVMSSLMSIRYRIDGNRVLITQR
ncbi:MAG: FecR family protein [Alistipes shahii]